MTFSRAVEDILAERRRQVEAEGWSPEHDDAHDEGQLFRAAMCYFAHAMDRASYRPDGTPMGWPWESRWWKPKDKRRDLVRAGALCHAEKDRFHRLRPPIPLDRRVDQKLRLIIAEIEQIDRARAILQPKGESRE